MTSVATLRIRGLGVMQGRADKGAIRIYARCVARRVRKRDAGLKCRQAIEGEPQRLLPSFLRSLRQMKTAARYIR